MDNLVMYLEVNITLHFDFIKAERMTQDYPGHPAKIDINAISIEGVEVSEEVFSRLMRLYEDNFIEEIMDKAAHGERGEVQTESIFYKPLIKQGETHV